MRVIIATVQVPFVHGGAEVLAADLCKALLAHGHEAEIVAIPFKGGPPECLLDQMLACRLFDLSEFNGTAVDRLIALKFPAYLLPHPRKVVWLLHQHRPAYDLFDHQLSDLKREPRGVVLRDAIRDADRRLLPEARAIFTISKNVTRRLQRYNDIESAVLYPPVQEPEKFYCVSPSEDYLFFPSRIAPLKRQELVIEALAVTREKVRVHFSGRPDHGSEGERLEKLTAKLGVEDRVEWLGRLSEAEKRDTYARCVGVVFPPVDEDYGYVTLEAMLSSKPVVTCRDSGGPLEFVRDGETGFITEPEPIALAQALDQLWRDRALAASLGRKGREAYEKLALSWTKVVATLLA